MSEQKKGQASAPPIKKQHSYTYWVDQNNKSKQLPEHNKPKKIEPPLQIQQNLQPTGPSKWNTSGTWQQRTVPIKELNDNVKQTVQDWLTEAKCELALNEVSLEGQFKQIFSNNKRKVLYQISGKLKFQGNDLELKLIEVTCSGDREYEVKGKSEQEKVKLDSVADKLVEAVVQLFGRYKE